MDNYQTHTSTSTYVTRLDQTLKALQERVQEQEAALEKVEAPSLVNYPSYSNKSIASGSP